MPTVRHTQINVLEESQVQCGSDGVVRALGEQNTAAIVALVDGFQDVVGIIFATTSGLDFA